MSLVNVFDKILWNSYDIAQHRASKHKHWMEQEDYRYDGGEEGGWGGGGGGYAYVLCIVAL